MTKKRNRSKQTLSLQERIARFSDEVREKAQCAEGQQKEELLKRLRSAEMATEFDRETSRT